jgi:hypothetical protein
MNPEENPVEEAEELAVEEEVIDVESAEEAEESEEDETE